MNDAGDFIVFGVDLPSGLPSAMGCDLSISHSKIAGDVWSRGTGALSISNSSITGNVWSLEPGEISIADCSIAGSVRSQHEGEITLSNSSIEGDIWSRGSDNLVLTNTTVQGNVWHRGDIYITDSEIFGKIQCDRYVYRDGKPPVIINYYTVLAGDTLWALARMCLGSGSRWVEIQSLNGIDDPQALPVGMTINIPPR